MEATVTIPDDAFQRAEELATTMGWSRNSLYAEALSEFIRRRQQTITDRLDELYAKLDSGLDPALQQAQSDALPQERW